MRGTALVALVLLTAAFVPLTTAQLEDAGSDIAVTDVNWTTTEDGGATVYQFNATVENNGTGARNTEFNVTFTLDRPDTDGPVFQSVRNIEPDDDGFGSEEAKNVEAPEEWEAKPGNYTLTVSLDVGDEGPPEEANENDERSRSFDRPGPDLLVEDVYLDPASPVATQETQFSAKVKNDASHEYDVDPEDPGFRVAFDVHDTTVYSAEIAELRGGENKTVTATTNWTPPSEGAYTVNATVNPEGKVDEVDARNNHRERAFSVKANAPDLALVDVSPLDTKVEAGNQTAFQATIQNKGHEAVDSDFPVRFLVDGSPHGPDVHAQIDSLSKGETTTVTSEAWTASQGHFTISAVADPGNDNVTGETTQENNQLDTDLHVGPDLVVDDLSWDPPTPAENAEVDVYALVLNQGTVNVTEASTLQVEVDDQTWTADIDPLAAGNSTNVHVGTWTDPAQNDNGYDVVAEADVDDDAQEIDDGNNGRTESMVVTGPLPDLVTTQVELVPSEPADGEEVQIQATIQNNGSRDTSDVPVEFRVDGEQVGERKTVAGDFGESLAADGGSEQVTSDPWTAETGQPEVTVIPDPEGDVTEIRTDNNNRSRGFLVGPDATVTDIAMTPEKPETGQQATFEITVANEGTEDIASLPVEVRMDGEEIASEDLSNLDAGSQTTLEATWETEEGDHSLRAIADPAGDVAEAREDNNAQEFSFSTDDSPDLQVTSIQWSTSPRAGDKLKFSAQVKNTGTAKVTGSFDTSFTIDGEKIGTDSVDGLGIGASTTVTSDAWTATAGSHTVRAHADSGGGVQEDNEANNKRAEAVSVEKASDSDGGEDPGPPNLVVDSVSLPEGVEPGDEVSFLATIENAGSSKAAASQARFLVDGESLGQPDVDVLEPGQGISVSSDTWNASRGEHTVTVVADVLDDVDESDEDDNEQAAQLQIGNVSDSGDDGSEDGEARVSLSALGTVDPPRVGEPVRLTVDATNDGGSPASTTVTFFVDGTRLGQASVEDLEPDETVEVVGPEWEPTEGEHTLTAKTDEDQVEAIVEATQQEPTPAPGVALILVLAALAALGRRRD